MGLPSTRRPHREPRGCSRLDAWRSRPTTAAPPSTDEVGPRQASPNTARGDSVCRGTARETPGLTPGVGDRWAEFHSRSSLAPIPRLGAGREMRHRRSLAVDHIERVALARRRPAPPNGFVAGAAALDTGVRVDLHAGQHPAAVRSRHGRSESRLTPSASSVTSRSIISMGEDEGSKSSGLVFPSPLNS